MKFSVVFLSLIAAAVAEEESCELNTKFPRIVIGCWQLTERVDEEAAVDVLQKYVSAGFHAFDTADIYGASETLLGRLRSRLGTSGDSPIVHTKYVTKDASLQNARRVNRQSREALGAIPALVQFHWWDFDDARFVNAARHLVKLQGEGFLENVAACNFDTVHLTALVDAGIPVFSNQVQYSLLDRRPENGMIAYAREHGIKLAVFGTVAGGWLSDRWLGVPTKPSPRHATVSFRMYSTPLERWSGGRWDLFQELLRTLRMVADRLDTTIANVAVAWVLAQLGPTGGWVILGVRDTTHLADHNALRTGKVQLTAEDLASIQAVLDQGSPPRGDIWGHERGQVQ